MGCFSRASLWKAVLLILAAMPGPTVSWADAPRPAERLNADLLGLKPNTWHKFHQPKTLDWRRQAHAGIAYDSRRGTLLVFGSDTHGRNWDNSVHEFDPVTARWSTHYPRAPKGSYRADPQGRAIAGTGQLLPWSMHTYDNVVYDPALDAVVVTGLPEHNPIKQQVPKAKTHPTWIYDLKSREWSMLASRDGKYPKFFAAASAYDSHRDVVAAYKWGMWELGPKRERWRKATGESHHRIHYNMEYDSTRKVLAVFGDHSRTNDVWIYRPAAKPGGKGQWEKRTPGGDPFPRDQHFPVAFDSHRGMFLLLPDNTRYVEDDNGRTRRRPARSSSTFVYDPERNHYTRLPDADMPRLKMNYMMVYDPRHRAFLLVTGDHRAPPTVWALKLDLAALGR